jgi:uncharacterized protein YcbK (DUF882 family)
MISRRSFLKCAVAFACSYQLGSLSNTFASTDLEGATERVLSLYNIHTGERLRTRYWAGGDYCEEEVGRINYLLRCHYANVVKPISLKVIDLLYELTDRFARGKEINIISGYRSAEYNEYLRHLGRHVAGGSLHLAGLAIDFAIPGVRTEQLSKAAVQFQAGGVGLYPDFLHIDVGRVRCW